MVIAVRAHCNPLDIYNFIYNLIERQVQINFSWTNCFILRINSNWIFYYLRYSTSHKQYTVVHCRYCNLWGFYKWGLHEPLRVDIYYNLWQHRAHETLQNWMWGLGVGAWTNHTQTGRISFCACMWRWVLFLHLVWCLCLLLWWKTFPTGTDYIALFLGSMVELASLLSKLGYMDCHHPSASICVCWAVWLLFALLVKLVLWFVYFVLKDIRENKSVTRLLPGSTFY